MCVGVNLKPIEGRQTDPGNLDLIAGLTKPTFPGFFVNALFMILSAQTNNKLRAFRSQIVATTHTTICAGIRADKM